MSSRRSDNLDLPATAAVLARPRAMFSYAPPRAGGWLNTLIANGPLPLLVLVVIAMGFVVERRGFGAYYQRMVMLVGFNVVLAVSLQLINGFSGQFSLGHAGFMAVGAYLAAYPAMNHSNRLTDPAGSLLFYVALFVVVGIGAGVVYGVFVLLRLTRKIHTALPAILLVGVLVWLLVDVAHASKYESPPGYLIWSNGIGLLTAGFTKTIAAGAPVAAKISAWLPAMVAKPLNYLVLLVGGGCCAAAAGLVVGLPTLRLRGDYLAIATLGLSEIIRIAIQNSQPLGGALGLTGIPKATTFAWLYGVALIMIIVIWRIAYSAKGRAIMAVREDEIAAGAIGVDPTHHKVNAFVIGAFFGGVAGAMFAL